MPLKYKNRAMETSISTGTGDFTLDGAYDDSYFTFYGDGDQADDIDVGDEFSYAIWHEDEFAVEGGKATCLTVTPTFTFSRDTIEFSTNKVGDTYLPVDFIAGSKKVFVTPTAADLQVLYTLLSNQAAHTVYAGPTSSTATPTFRALVSGDIPDLSATYATPAYVASQLSSYSTSAQINTLLGDYLTITSAAATYSTPASVATQISGATILTSQLSGTLAIAQFADNVITSAKIVSLAASKLTGTVSPTNGGMGADTSSLTGIYKFTAGVPSLAVAGTDYLTTVAFSQVTGTATNAQLPTAITGKTIDNSVIGGTTPAAGTFTSVRVGSVYSGWEGAPVSFESAGNLLGIFRASSAYDVRFGFVNTTAALGGWGLAVGGSDDTSPIAGTNTFSIYNIGAGLPYLSIRINGWVGFAGLKSATAPLDIPGDIIRLRTAKTPASASDTGDQGDICWDSSYIYVATATNTWKRAALSTW